MLNRKDLLSQCVTKTSTFKSSLGEIKLRQLTISESEEIAIIQNDTSKTMKDTMVHTLRCAMVEPTFFTDEELETLGTNGANFMREVFIEVPLIGMSKKEREDYNEKVKKFLEENNKEISEDEKEGK